MFFVDGDADYKGIVVFIIIQGFSIVFLNAASVFFLVYRIPKKTQNRRRGSSLTPDKQILTSLCVANFTTGSAVVVEFTCYAAGEPVSSKKITVLAFIILFSLIVSLIHILLLSIERFVSIKFPFKHRELKTRTTSLVLLSVWLLSMAPTCFILYSRSGALKTISVIMIATDLVLVFSSVYIVTITRRVLNNQNNLCAYKGTQKRLQRQITKFWCTIVVSYLLFTIPPVAVMIAKNGKTMTFYYGSKLQSVMLILMLMKAIVDPIVYILMNQVDCCATPRNDEDNQDDHSLQKTYTHYSTSGSSIAKV